MTGGVSNGYDFDPGTPGASARREGERRRANRERRTREKHPHTAGLRLALGKAPTYESAWETGAAGEEKLGAFLTHRCPTAEPLHDRRMPGSRANIDHLAIAPSGVYVIDAKRYKGKIEVRKPLFGKPKLMIAGRNKLERLISAQA
jgi:Nuclease-related domain